MGFIDVLDSARPGGVATVPRELLGCWRRNWIRFDGEPERDVRVVWLQTASGMGDIRIDPTQAPHDNDSSCGITVVDQSTTPYMTADWHDGSHGFAQQTVSNFPEKGWLDWKSSTVMHELAPSGAYVEEWERLPGSSGIAAHLVATDAATTTNLYIAGAFVLLAVRSADPDGVHEFSLAKRRADTADHVVELSTIADRVGQPLAVDHTWHVESYTETAPPAA